MRLAPQSHPRIQRDHGCPLELRRPAGPPPQGPANGSLETEKAMQRCRHKALGESLQPPNQFRKRHTTALFETAIPLDLAMVSPASCLLQPGTRAAGKPRAPWPHPEVEATMRHQQRKNHAEIRGTLEPLPGRDWPQAAEPTATGSPTRQPRLRSGFRGPRP